MSDFIDRLNPASYSFRARVRPVLFVSVPLALAIWNWTQQPLELNSWVVSLLVAAGIPYILSEKTADAGRRRERALWASWGGAPTTQLLRHRDNTLNAHTRARVRAGLTRICPDLMLPSAEEESADPAAADAIYDSCIDRLRVLSRSDPLVLKANIAYGFRRNLWAIRWWGVAACLAANLSALAHIGFGGLRGEALVTLAASTLMLLFLVFVVRAGWVFAAAHVYARRLLETVERTEPAVNR